MKRLPPTAGVLRPVHSQPSFRKSTTQRQGGVRIQVNARWRPEEEDATHPPHQSHCSSHFGGGQCFGFEHDQVQSAGSHCVTQSGRGAQHVALHVGGSQRTTHEGQRPPTHRSRSAHTTRQRGGSHCVRQRGAASGLHLMRQAGGLHIGVHDFAHSLGWQTQRHLGQRSSAVGGVRWCAESAGAGHDVAKNDSLVARRSSTHTSIHASTTPHTRQRPRWKPEPEREVTVLMATSRVRGRGGE